MILVVGNFNELITNNFLFIKSLKLQDHFQLWPQISITNIVNYFETIITAINMLKQAIVKPCICIYKKIRC